MEKKQRGGKRAGAGRKPLLLKKKSVFLYVELGLILKFGNEDNMKAELYDFINKFGEEEVWESKLIEGETKPFSNSRIFVPENSERELVIVRTYNQWLQMKQGCENDEEWAEISEGISNAENLSLGQKQSLLS